MRVGNHGQCLCATHKRKHREAQDGVEWSALQGPPSQCPSVALRWAVRKDRVLLDAKNLEIKRSSSSFSPLPGDGETF